MASEWLGRTVESVCTRVTTGGTPSRRRPEFFENGTIPWFKTGELRDRLLYDSEEHITTEALAASSAKIFPIHTVLMAMYGDGDTITNLGVLLRPAATTGRRADRRENGVSTPLKPWTRGPFELLVHAELHRLDGDDFDRRMAMISFDNAIEVAITTYLGLNPIQRNKRQYQKVDVEKWLTNFHTKIDFFMIEVANRSLTVLHEQADIVWYHDSRNEQYHGGKPSVPLIVELETIRRIAIWVFSVLFEIPDAEARIGETIALRRPQPTQGRTPEYDGLIDDAYGMCSVAGDTYKTSDALHALDAAAYAELGESLKQQPEQEGNPS